MSDPNSKWTLDHIDYSDAPTLWLVNLRDEEGQIISQAAFSGNGVEQLAREYAAWKNSKVTPEASHE